MVAKTSRRFLLIGFASLLALWAGNQHLYAQAVYGSIVGTVTDSSGAAVPGATVTTTNVGKGVVTTTTTNESGYYQQQHLIVGVYNVRIEKEGFQAYIQNGVQVNVDAAIEVDTALKLGAVTQTVEVTSSVPLLKTEKTDVATSFSEKEVEDLPIFNRNFTAFELLTPGTQRLGWQHAASENPQGAIQIMVNGQHFSGTDYDLDGTSNQDPILGIIVINPNLDAVTEAKMTTQNYDAEYGEATAGFVSTETKSGTNEWHGDAFEYNRVNATSARDPFTQCGAGCGGVSNVPHSVWNQFGGSVGGPIKKDKIFIFGDYQGTRRALGGSAQARVPTAAERAGDMSALAAAAGVNIYDPFDASGNILAPSARQQFVASNNAASPNFNSLCSNAAGCPNMIPTSFLTTAEGTAAGKMLANIPMPNATSARPTDNNYFASGSQTFNSDGFDVRGDAYKGDKTHFFGRYSLQRFSRQGPGLFGTEVGGPTFNVDPSVGGFAGASSVLNHSVASGFDYTLSPTLLTDFRFGWVRYRVFVNPNGLGTSPAKDAGIPGLNLDNYYTSGMPYFSLDGTGGLSWGYSLGSNQCNCPLNEQEMQFQFVNNWTNIRGNHTLKAGADIRYALNLRVPSDSHRAGELHFNNTFTEGPSGGGLPLATYLLGDTTFFTRYVSNVTNAAERQKRWFFYGQDTWRVTPKLTLNYGLRWELYFPQTVNGANHGGWVDIATGETLVAGSQGVNLAGNVNNSYTNFAPRLGIAYQITPRTVLRMGYGRSFDIGTFGSIFGHTVTQNLPVLAQQAVNPANNYSDVFTLAQGPPALDPSTILSNNCLNAGGTGPNLITNPTGTKTQCLGATGRPLYPDGVSPHVHPASQRLLTVDAWNVTVQHAFTNSMSAEVGYVANKGTHVFNGDGPNYNINQATIVGFAQGLSTNAREPFYNRYGWSEGVQWYGNDTSSNYESVQAKFDKRFGSGYEISANYTYARANQYDGDGYYIYNPSLVYGPSDFQRRQVFILTNVVALPFGHGRKYLSSVGKMGDALVGGWQFNGAWTAMSGTPFTPGYQNAGADRDTGPGYPNLIGAVHAGTRSGNPEVAGYWYQGTGGQKLTDSSSPCLSTPGPAINGWQDPGCGVFGNAGIDSMWGPGLFNADLSLFKNFQVTERLKAQLRAESFNTFNHVNLGGPDGCVDCSTSGRITDILGSANMREWQFSLRLEF